MNKNNIGINIRVRLKTIYIITCLESNGSLWNYEQLKIRVKHILLLYTPHGENWHGLPPFNSQLQRIAWSDE